MPIRRYFSKFPALPTGALAIAAVDDICRLSKLANLPRHRLEILKSRSPHSEGAVNYVRTGTITVLYKSEWSWLHSGNV
jgi:hypothetical protein